MKPRLCDDVDEQRMFDSFGAEHAGLWSHSIIVLISPRKMPPPFAVPQGICFRSLVNKLGYGRSFGWIALQVLDWDSNLGFHRILARFTSCPHFPPPSPAHNELRVRTIRNQSDTSVIQEPTKPQPRRGEAQAFRIAADSHRVGLTPFSLLAQISGAR